MAETKKSDDNKRIIDVEHPGKTAPSPNSKAVIITNRPILKDPMMVEEGETPEDSGKVELTKKSDNKLTTSTAPPLPTDTKQSDDAKDSPKTESAPIANKPDDNKSAPTEDGQTPADDKGTEDKSAETPPVEAKTPDSSAAKPASLDPTAQRNADDNSQPKTAQTGNKSEAANIEAEEKEAAKHQAEVEKLISSKQYFLPITTNEERRSKHFLILGILFSLLLVALWVDVALDAHLIHIHGIKPLTHFFSS